MAEIALRDDLARLRHDAADARVRHRQQAAALAIDDIVQCVRVRHGADRAGDLGERRHPRRPSFLLLQEPRVGERDRHLIGDGGEDFLLLRRVGAAFAVDDHHAEQRLPRQQRDAHPRIAHIVRVGRVIDRDAAPHALGDVIVGDERRACLGDDRAQAAFERHALHVVQPRAPRIPEVGDHLPGRLPQMRDVETLDAEEPSALLMDGLVERRRDRSRR